MARSVMISSLPKVFAVVKEMQGSRDEWGEDTRAAARDMLTKVAGPGPRRARAGGSGRTRQPTRPPPCRGG